MTGFQYATLRFTNSSAKACNLTGFPSVQLMLGGRPLGSPATHTSAQPTTVWIAPGKSATAQLRNDSTCNADNSDSVQVVAPGAGTTTVQPLRRRGCAATVDPVIAG